MIDNKGRKNMFSFLQE